MTTNAKSQWADKPTKLRMYTLTVDRLDASNKYEGKWVLNGTIHGVATSYPVKLWMSQKQASSVQRNLESETIYAVLDVIDAEKPRFVWASDNLEWLSKAFLKQDKGAIANPAEDFAATQQAKVAKEMTGAFKTAPSYVQQPTRFESGEEELPF